MTTARLLPDLIDRNAAAAPDRGAVRFLKRSLDQAGLATQTNQLAHALRDAGVRRGDRVGILAPKGLESALALYGIMKAGAAYVPIDPSAPLERQEFIIRDCGINCLITAPSQRSRLQELESRGARFAGLFGLSPQDTSLVSRCFPWEEVQAYPAERPEVEAAHDDPAYIIYTSGSTGTPKGIMHTHASGLAFARWAAEAYGLNHEDRLSNHAPLHFDLSIFDYFAGAVAGAATIIIPEAYTRLPASYTQLLQDERVSVLFTVPFALIQMHLHGVLDDRDLSALRFAIFGGEPFPAKFLRLLMKRLPHTRFDNMYGPAEINGCTHFTLPSPPASDTEAVPIGPLNPICEGLIVDHDLHPVTPGESGELLVHTPTMMQGYWKRPDLNAGAFETRDGKTYYRTGDLVRDPGDGNLVFLGRSDRQVKSRGYRVELDEVEAAVVSHDAIEEAAAYLVVDDGESRIELAATLRENRLADPAEILEYAKSRLPWYAVPASIDLAVEFPRTTTGKIDRRTLQSRAQAQARQSNESRPLKPTNSP